jgi:hypothetical protein
MRWIAENRQYQFQIAGRQRLCLAVAGPPRRGPAFEKVPFDRSTFSEKSAQAANEQPRVRLL